MADEDVSETESDTTDLESHAGESTANTGPVSYTHLTLPTNREV